MESGLTLIGSLAFACALLATLSCGESHHSPSRAGGSSAAAAGTATLLRDAYGAPHVFADTPAAAAYAFGYAQAEDRLEAILRHYKEARGERAELDGPAALEQDIGVRAFRIPETAREKLPTLPAEIRDELAAFAAGVNRFQKDHPEKRPPWAFDVTAEDVAAFALFVNLSFARDPYEQTPESTGPAPGSNAFAIARARTASSKGSLVSLDPHLPLSGFLRWYEGHVSSGGSGGVDVAGVTFAGLPYVLMGHNGAVAWANTVNDPDLSDLYEVRLSMTDGRPTHYEYENEKRPLTLRTFEVKVRQSDGSLKTVPQAIPYTHHGPILLQAGGKAFAVRKAGVGDLGILEQARALGRARSVEDLRRALAGRHIVMFNYVFGDADGRIGYVWNGQIPRRPEGYDWRKPVPGWLKAAEWGDPVPFAELPQATDPPGGVLHSCNDGPTRTGAGSALKPHADPAKYPDWLAPDTRTLRGSRLATLLAAKPKWSPDDAKAAATDAHDLFAARERPALIAAAKAATGLSDEDTKLRDECVQVLSAWDGVLTADAKGAALFQAWNAAFAEAKVGGLSWRDTARPPLASAHPEEAVRTLLTVARRFAAGGVPLDVPWGAVHRLQRGKHDLPADGGFESLVPNAGRPDATGKAVVTFGSSFRMLVELGNGPVRAWSCLPFGNSDDPASPHYADQMPLAARRGYRSFPFARAEVEKEATARRVLAYDQGP
jgi:Protein related to penicillin acylase